ncbi:DNRLRE domain-containing protein [Streptomyces durbertensis]|uniref:DNRLRE domain-containing protein n=1 Tax=Streptomyces durbertensis TaxID=2448886 RepID=A0ABR6EJF0_9ACTN|nr:DNRLRE domain-containing protein [Streptomyces durbertensis]MBB1245463.1 DNRLRE domain-containing protein [Streptomyces durbertensis]
MKKLHRLRPGMPTRHVAHAVIGALVVGWAVTGETVASAEAPTAVPAAADSESSEDAAIGAARRRAAATGERSEVEALRTESSTTYANPDGSLTEESTTGPIRVRGARGEWRKVDTTLVYRDGVVRPKQAATDIAFSGGAGAPLAQVSAGEQSFGIGWDGELPRPTLRGNTALYRDVQPDTDLVLTALPEGFSHHFVLKKRPKEKVELRIPVVAEGLDLKKTADKRLLWKDADGDEVATAPVPVMWGAAEGTASGEPEKVTDVAVSVETSRDEQTLVLKPDDSFLADEGVKYPVVVDPTNTLLGPATDTWIQDRAYPSSQRGSTELKAGTYNGTERARSYLKFNTTRFAGKRIVDASLRLYSHWSSSCSTANSGIQVRRITSDWDPSAISWSQQPSTTTAAASVSKAAKGYNSTCPAGQVSWNVNGIVQAWADGQPDHGLRLAAVDETDPLTWRRYRSANYVSGSHDAANEPSLIVTYNSAPGTPTALGLSPLKADTMLTTAGTLTPTLRAKVSDSDAQSSLVTEFQVQPDPAFADTTYTWTGKTAAFAPGATATVQVPAASALPDGAHLRMRARTSDGVDTSAWSGWTVFRVDATALAPADPPAALQTGATDTPTPLVSGIVTSPNGGMVEAQFRLRNPEGTETLGTQLVENGQRASFQIPADRLTGTGPFAWSMRACYSSKCSAWTTFASIAAGSSGGLPTPPVPMPSATVPLSTASACVGDSGCVGRAGTPLRVGEVSGRSWRTYLKADLSKLPAGAQVTNAVLNLHTSGTTPRVAVHALNEEWTTEGTGDSLDAVSAPEANLMATAPWELDVTALVTGWTDDANVNHGLVLRMPKDAPNGAGISFSSATLTVEYGVATAPSTPTGLRARAGDGGALVTWNASKDSGYNDSVLTYEVTAVDATGAVVAKKTTEGTDAVLTGLTNGTSHTFRVTASNPYGTSGRVTSGAITPVSASPDGASYVQAVREYLQASASMTTGAHHTAASATRGRTHAARYSSLLKAEESWLIDTRDALNADDLTFTSITSTVSDALVMPASDGSVAVRAKVREQRFLADSPADPETSEEIVLFSFAGDTPSLRSKMDATQYEQRLPRGEEAFIMTTYGTVEDGTPSVRSSSTGGLVSEQRLEGPLFVTPFATIDAKGTSKWARANYNAPHEYSQNCTNYVSKALYHGGGMRMKGTSKDRKSINVWWRTKHMAPPHSGGGIYYLNSHTWTVADHMRRFFDKHSKGVVNTETKQQHAKVGDVVFFKWGGKGNWDHTGVVTKMSKGKAYVSAQNRNRLDQRLDVFLKKSEKGTWADIVRVEPGWY